MKSPEINELAKALSQCQSELKGAVKDANNPFFKSKYADLESVWDACRVPLSKNSLAVVQTADTDEKYGICIITTLMHTSGQWISSKLPIMATRQDPQGMGSAITYSRRYSLAAIVGIVQTDDDAEGAMGRKTSGDKRVEDLLGPAITKAKEVFPGTTTIDPKCKACGGLMEWSDNLKALACRACYERNKK